MVPYAETHLYSVNKYFTILGFGIDYLLWENFSLLFFVVVIVLEGTNFALLGSFSHSLRI